jgi:3-oxocholest-4-en-26-oate---CoA ligase
MEFNLYDVVAAVAAAHPDRETMVFGSRRLSASELIGRANQFGHALLEAGLTVSRERSALDRHESGQPHVAIYARNRQEHIEALIGCFSARAVPLNVNYRYLAAEVRFLFDDAAVGAVVFASEFAPVMADVVAQMATRPLLLVQIADESGHPLLKGARWFDELLAGQPTHAPDVNRSPDDLYGLYTGGTTGLPKLVLWRQADAFPPLFGGRRPDSSEWDSVEQIVAASGGGVRHMPVAPFMHAAGQWPAVRALVAGTTLVVPPLSATFAARHFVDIVEREHVAQTNIVGDAFIWPLVDELRRRPRDLSSLKRVGTGGAAASPRARQALLTVLPHIEIYETAGASETGALLAHSTKAGGPFVSGSFTLLPRACVLSEDRTTVLTGGSDEVGWLAATHRVPLGYLGDAAKTAATFPIIDGVRFTIPGDRVLLRADGLIDLLGRDSGVINTGGEKVFAEEVERALLTHPGVHDAVVCARPSERWGAEVVAIIAADDHATDAAIGDAVRARLAAYKVPKAFVRVPTVVRGPNGKVDLAWARVLAEASALPAPVEPE